MPLLSIEQVRDGLLRDPSIFAQKIDFVRRATLFLKLDARAYQAASFLDDRILTAQTEGRWVAFAEAAPWFEGPPATTPVHFIFHSGHVGSTLVSRMLDEAGGVLGVREPSPLRTLAEADDERGAADALATPELIDALLAQQVRLWRRGYGDTRAVVVKATSATERMAPRVLDAAPEARALFLNLAAEPFLAKLLSGENSYLDLRTAAPERYRRLSRLAETGPHTPLSAMSLGEVAALSWAAETATQRRAAAAFGERTLALDFDDFLAAPGEAMRRVCGHFGIAAPEGFFTRESPSLARYSKAPERAYNPALRQQILAESRARNAGEIGKGLAWLEEMGKRAPAIGALLR